MTLTRLDDAAFDWASGAGGAGTLRAIAYASLQHDGADPLNEAARLALRHHGLDGAVVFLGDDHGNPSTVDRGYGGFAYVHGLVGDGRPEVDLAVDPESRRRGLGTMLLEAVLELTQGIPLTAWSHGDHRGARVLAGRHGFVPTRELWVLRRPAGPVPDVPLPVGFTLRPFSVGADEEGLLAVNAAAFADHPEQGGLTRAQLDERIAEPWFSAEGLLMAEHGGGNPAGFHWTKLHRSVPGGPLQGEVYVIGVAPDAQGSGLGRALLVAGIDHLQRAGAHEIHLYVEASNTAALGLYSSLGFTHRDEDTHVLYRGPLP